MIDARRGQNPPKKSSSKSSPYVDKSVDLNGPRGRTKDLSASVKPRERGETLRLSPSTLGGAGRLVTLAGLCAGLPRVACAWSCLGGGCLRVFSCLFLCFFSLVAPLPFSSSLPPLSLSFLLLLLFSFSFLSSSLLFFFPLLPFLPPFFPPSLSFLLPPLFPLPFPSTFLMALC